MAVSPEELRIAMRRWATGVTIVTTRLDDVRHGMTVNSFVCHTLIPPLVSVSLENITRTNQLVQGAGFYGVTILSEGQQEVSDCFAGRHTEHLDRFAGLEIHELITGAPFLSQGLAFLDCQVIATHSIGTHTIYIAEIVALQLGSNEPPILYYNQAYWKLDHMIH